MAANDPAPAPALVLSEMSLARPAPVQPVPGFAHTFDRRGDRALVHHHAGWAGKFVGVASDGDENRPMRLLCQTGLTTFAAWLDDDHVMITEGNEAWVGRITPDGFALVSGVEGVSGPITRLPDDMIAIGRPNREGLRLLAFRHGRLRLYRGKIKPPADAAQLDRTLVVHEARVFAVGTDCLELRDWSLAAEWEPRADWDKAVKKLLKDRAVPIAETAAATAATAASPWRFDDEGAAVRVADRWCRIAVPGGLSGPHYAELPEPTRGFVVGRRVCGALDRDRGVAWLVTGSEQLVRARVDATANADAEPAAGEVVANLSPVFPDADTMGVFPVPDGRVAVLGRQHIAIVDPSGAAEPWGVALGLTVCAAVPLGGPLIAYASVWPSDNKHGAPTARLSLVELGAFPRDWLTWELPMYAPTLRFDGRTLVAEEGERALAFDLEAALAWFPNFAGRDDVPALPPKPARKKK